MRAPREQNLVFAAVCFIALLLLSLCSCTSYSSRTPDGTVIKYTAVGSDTKRTHIPGHFTEEDTVRSLAWMSTVNSVERTIEAVKSLEAWEKVMTGGQQADSTDLKTVTKGNTKNTAERETTKRAKIAADAADAVSE